MEFFILLIGLIMLISGAEGIVRGSVSLAKQINVSLFAIGVVIVAAGTSAPEFATSITAALKGRHGIAVGNLIGSDLFNLLGVLGLAGMINPSDLDQSIFDSVFLLVLMVGLTLFMIRTNWKISRLEGGILVSINLIRWYFDFTI